MVCLEFTPRLLPLFAACSGAVCTMVGYACSSRGHITLACTITWHIVGAFALLPSCTMQNLCHCRSVGEMQHRKECCALHVLRIHVSFEGPEVSHLLRIDQACCGSHVSVCCLKGNIHCGNECAKSTPRTTMHRAQIMMNMICDHFQSTLICRTNLATCDAALDSLHVFCL